MRLKQLRSLCCELLAVSLLLACESKSDSEPAPAAVKENAAAKDVASAQPVAPSSSINRDSQKSVYNVPERSEAELASDLRAACTAAKAKASPLLIEFSAPWCGDCRRLAEMKKTPSLANALEKTPHYVVNIGHFDHHEALLDAFRVKSIAKWKVVSTDNCESPATEWKQLASRTLEPATGTDVVTSEDLVAWLDEKMHAPDSEALVPPAP